MEKVDLQKLKTEANPEALKAAVPLTSTWGTSRDSSDKMSDFTA